MNGAEVLSIRVLSDAINEVNTCFDGFVSKMNERLDAARRLMEETQNEERTSAALLEAAHVAEAAAQASLLAAEAHLAMLFTMSVENPACLAEIPAAMEAVSRCKEAYELAVHHRELMEHRFELAKQCLDHATMNLEQLENEFGGVRMMSDGIVKVQTARLAAAHRVLDTYSSLVNDTVVQEFEKWEKHKPEDKEPIRPDEIRSRLNPGKNVCLGLLAMLCAKDEKFRTTVQGYREAGSTNEVILKIRKNMAGRLAEEMVRGAFTPFGRSVDTQARTTFQDGTYTKTDLIVRNLVAPIILGRGEGMGAREGGDLGVEVKAGSGSYILSQKEHLQFQALGHAACQVSCTICTRDIGTVSSDAESALRQVMHDSGSPVLGMLPYKKELDDICIEFVFGEQSNV